MVKYVSFGGELSAYFLYKIVTADRLSILIFELCPLL